MEQRVCNFCGQPLEPGTGMMFIKKDGSVYYFDRQRCQTSLLYQHRLGRRFKWTKHYPRGGAKAAEEEIRKQQIAAEIAKAETAEKAGKKTPAKAKR